MMSFIAKATGRLILLIFGLAVGGAAGEAADLALGSGDNRTAEYEVFLRDEAFDRASVEARFAAVIPALREMQILIVPSYLSDSALAARAMGLTDYFAHHETWLRKAGAEVAFAAIESEGTVAENAAVIASAVRAARKPVCLVTHSKGGLDTLEFLVQAGQDQLDKIACWISLQAPFRGTPLADAITDSPVLAELAGTLLAVMGGSQDSLIDLRTDTRLRYLAERAAVLTRVLRVVPTLCLASRVDRESVDLVPLMAKQMLDWLSERDIPSDGVVPTASAILPRAPFVIARGVDHGATVATPLLVESDFDQTLMLKVLFILLLGPQSA